jgi:predicted O-methyltransferase YrrM
MGLKVSYLSLHGLFQQQGGISQTVFHLGRFAEWLRVGELALAPLNELLSDDVLLPEMERSVADLETWMTRRFESVFEFRLFRILLFTAIRLSKPGIVVETGVLHGMTSFFILRALELNGHGRLISIDLPSYHETGPSNRDGYASALPPGKQPGWIVPAQWRANWDLRLGSTSQILSSASPDFDQIGVFCHDSEHTTETMWLEFGWAWPRLAPGGLLVCDNIEASTAFSDFSRKVGRDAIYFPAPGSGFSSAPRFGVIMK